MIELPWKKEPPVDKKLLELYIDRMVSRSKRFDVFAILMPVSIFTYIKYEGINARFTKLPDPVGTDTVWVKVTKFKKNEKESIR